MKAKMKAKPGLWAAAAILALASSSSAQLDFTTVPCFFISAIYDVVSAVGPSLVAIMFVYGGVKYAYGADNPGGRNQGRTICIHAIIGGILFIMWRTVWILLFSAGGFGRCW